MIRGLAQVIGMKPTLRSFFSGVPLVWAMASSAPKGTSEEIAAQAVEAPTAERNLRRSPSWGNSAFITAVWITRLFSASTSPAATAMSCWVCEAWLPQVQPAMELFASNGSFSAMVLSRSSGVSTPLQTACQSLQANDLK
jgi:hypothetical protein